MIPVTFSLPDEQCDQLDALVALKGLPEGELVRRAIDLFLDDLDARREESPRPVRRPHVKRKRLKVMVEPDLLWGRAKNLRASETPSEKKLWSSLRRQALGARFRRQHPLGSIIVDFYCIELALIVEVDGQYHSTPEMVEKDFRRVPVTIGMIEAAIARLRK